jgi:hypothetical protein
MAGIRWGEWPRLKGGLVAGVALAGGLSRATNRRVVLGIFAFGRRQNPSANSGTILRRLLPLVCHGRISHSGRNQHSLRSRE